MKNLNTEAQQDQRIWSVGKARSSQKTKHETQTQKSNKAEKQKGKNESKAKNINKESRWLGALIQIFDIRRFSIEFPPDSRIQFTNKYLSIYLSRRGPLSCSP